MGLIYAEIGQTKPYELQQEEMLVSLLRTADIVRYFLEGTLKNWGISIEQYNVLRILKGAKDNCCPTLDIASKMVSRAPNITRLLDKLIDKGFVSRGSCPDDRRIVFVRLTHKGASILAESSVRLKKAVITLTPFGRNGMKSMV
ncbi:MAG: MarR family transcriptional regulator, partial [Planctomycetes bacterium]|nr:MarR family transcriptional regulator [Planctomycetota bacterium]